MDILGALGAIAEVVGTIAELIGLVKDEVTEVTDIFVQGGTEIIGFADAVSTPIVAVKDAIGEFLPSNFVVMIGIALTTMIALATRRSMNA